jgi:hypothetical protein
MSKVYVNQPYCKNAKVLLDITHLEKNLYFLSS